MTETSHPIVSKVDGGYFIQVPPIEDAELRLFTTFDGILDYMFGKLEPTQSQNMCKYLSGRLQHYCRTAGEEIQKELNDHLRDRHRYIGDAEREQLY
jgi:hypothetical protein